MGYETSYSLHWTAPEPQENPKWTELVAMVGTDRATQMLETGDLAFKQFVDLNDEIGDYIEGHEDMSYAVNRQGEAQNSCKWYEYRAHMLEMSKRFPTVEFTLRGEGENAGDIWEHDFLNGQDHERRASVTVPARTLF